jgi:hypothetical protein
VNIASAKRIAFGSVPTETLEEYYQAWQWLYDNDIELRVDDIDYLDKLICDGCVNPKEGYFEQEIV